MNGARSPSSDGRSSERPRDDPANLADLREALELMAGAEDALKAAIAGAGQASRDIFVDKTGQAIARLLAVWARIRPNDEGTL